MSAAPVETTPASLINAAGTRRRLQALVAIGWPQAQLARRMAVTPSRVAVLLRCEAVEAGTADAVEVFYDDLWNKPPAGPASARARSYARTRGWVPPLGWDDGPEDGHGIDDPVATPAAGWRRPDRAKWRNADLAHDALELIGGQGYTRAAAAARLGVTRSALDQAIARTRAANTTGEQENTMTEPVPKAQEARGELPAPGTPHPDPRLAARGWQACDHGIWTRHPERAREPEREAAG